MRILVVEDDAGVRGLLQDVVEIIGHECLVAADGEAGWQVFQDSGADVIISDWVMPRATGLDLCRRVRKDTRRPYAYFLILTALAGQMNLFQALEAGADDFLSKPLNVSELEARIGVAERVIALHREREALSRVEGVLLAARTLEHELNNKLAAAQGFAELLSISPELHPSLRPLVQEIDLAASDAARILERLSSVVRVEELDWGQDLPTTLDIDRSSVSAA